MMVNQILNHNCVNRAEVHYKGPAHVWVIVNAEHCQTVFKQSGNHNHDLFRLSSWTRRGRAGRIVETLN